MSSSRPCTVEGCPEPRVVYPSGVRSKCLEHIRERQREASRRWSEAHPGRKMEMDRRWRESNPERRAEIVRRHWEANKDRMRAASRRWREEHPDRQLESGRRWRENDREHAREIDHRKKERRAGLAGRYTRVILERDPRCGQPIRDTDRTEWGHEPPMAWLRRHSEYDGPCIVVPQHWACNHRNSTTPFWLLDWEGT